MNKYINRITLENTTSILIKDKIINNTVWDIYLYNVDTQIIKNDSIYIDINIIYNVEPSTEDISNKNNGILNKEILLNLDENETLINLYIIKKIHQIVEPKYIIRIHFMNLILKSSTKLNLLNTDINWMLEELVFYNYSDIMMSTIRTIKILNNIIYPINCKIFTN